MRIRHHSSWFHALALSSSVALSLPTIAACGSDGESPWQALSAEQARELPLLTDVAIVEMTREQFTAEAEARADQISEEYLSEYAETYGRMGFFDMQLDLRPIFAGSSSDWVGAQYSPSKKQVTLVGEAPDSTLVHEFVHALQDQHFGIGAYDLYDTSDGFLARRAVVEGDATLAQYRFIVYEEDGSDLDVIAWDQLLDSYRTGLLDLVLESAYPAIFLDYVSFTYPYGLEFSAHNLLGVSYEQPGGAPPPPHDWNRQNQLFTDRPPNTTRQILELDIDGIADGPTSNIGLSEVPVAQDSRLLDLDWDSMGEWSTYLMLLPLETAGTLGDPVGGARGVAGAWIGDKVLFVVDKATGDIGSVWALAWDDEVAAAVMARAMYTLYGAQVPLDGYLSTAANGEPVWIEQRATELVVIRNVAEDLAPLMAEAAFAGEAALAPRRRVSLTEAVDRQTDSRINTRHRDPALSIQLPRQ